MPRRHVLAERQRHALLALPTDEPANTAGRDVPNRAAMASA